MKRILSFSDFGLFEYHGFTSSNIGLLNEAVYLDQLNKRPHNEDALKKMRSCIFMLNGTYPFFSGLLSKLLIRENKRLPYRTMATDGVSIHYDPDYVLSKSDDEIIWVIAHEVLHNSLFHFLRCPKDNDKALIWNFATDYALNQLLTPVDESSGKPKPAAKGGIGKMPEGSLYPGCGVVPYDTEFVNRTAEWIFDKLIANGFNPNRKKEDGTKTPPPPPPPPIPPKVGDIIFDPNNDSYGIIKSIDEANGEVDYTPIPKSKVPEYMKRLRAGENVLDDDVEKELDF